MRQTISGTRSQKMKLRISAAGGVLPVDECNEKDN
mgnify:CR=1 FL=1